MRKILIGFSTPKKFKIGSQLIKLFEGTEYSHVYIGMQPSLNSKLPFTKVFEASYGDVHCLTYASFKEQNKIMHEYILEVEDEVYFGSANWLWSQLQKPYAFNQLLKIGLGITIGKKGDNSYICTELVGRMLKNYLKIELHKSLDYIGMKDMKNIIEGLDERFKF
jgi:uncharacterized protein YycO